jgi:pimeloyl-ACP methyl ester carboxylesterase/DNA-binding SARP family transcriptional activator
MLCLLGPPSIQNGERIELLRLQPKALALLARLAVGGEWLTRAELARLLFPDAEDPRRALRWHFSYLHSHLPDVLRADLTVSPSEACWVGDTDVAAFKREAAYFFKTTNVPTDSAASLTMRESAEDAARTLRRYRGDLCHGLVVSASPDFDEWLYVEQEALRRTFRQIAVAFGRWCLRVGKPQDATEWLARLASIDPFYEDGHLLLIEAYSAMRNLDAAKSAYERYARIVRHELQAKPAPFLARVRATAAGNRLTARRRLPAEGLVQLSEVTLHTLEWAGDEPAVLVIHGSATGAYALTVLAERLAPDARVIAFDLRGYGLSDKPPGSYRVEQHAADVRELIAALRLQRPVLLGFSLGGAIATIVASRPRIVSGLIMLDGVVGDQAFTATAAAKVLPMGTSMGRRYGGFAQYLANWRSTERLSSDAERLLERAVRYELVPMPDGTYRRRGVRRALEDTWASAGTVDTLALLGRVRCPVLIVQAALPWIGGEPYLSDSVIAAQLHAAPRARHFLARQCNHRMLVRDPDPSLIAAIKSFVAELGQRRVTPASSLRHNNRHARSST